VQEEVLAEGRPAVDVMSQLRPQFKDRTKYG
jgi:hypothetical protein